jgi:colanic acid biosynthesis protein WcaH
VSGRRGIARILSSKHFTLFLDQAVMDRSLFLTVIDATPLISIDLIVRTPQSEVLLGKRRKRPAQGFWFVPGGRIRKNERVAEALQRIAAVEIGWVPSPEDIRFKGVYEHLYDDNFHAAAGIGTHYVVLAHEVTVADDIRVAPDDQHTELRWWPLTRLMTRADVHNNTKAYFD